MRAWKAPEVPDLPGSSGTIVLQDSVAGLVELPPQSEAGLYVCGITPYDATHLGHAATYLTFDVLGRLFRDQGCALTYVQNVTDVDEPLLERAARDGVDWRDLAQEQVDLFREDMTALRVLPPDHFVGAVESIPGDIEAVDKLLASGAAYALPAEEGGSDYYLDLAHVPGFGRVSELGHDEMVARFRENGGDPDRRGKRDPLDPLLWRAQRTAEPAWPGGDLGPGRPGWHIECTTIALAHLGPAFTVQGGGSDLIFPHHEMSAAQCEALTGQPFAQVYVHQAMVGLDGEKMSKSKGNLVLVSVLRRGGADPMAIRLALLAQHHGTPWFWEDDMLCAAEARLARWRDGATREGAGEAVLAALRTALAGDLDTPAALAAVDGFCEEGLGQTGAAAVDALLGVTLR